MTAEKLALAGGAPVRQKPFTAWPVFDKTDEEALLRTLRSGKWWQFAYGYGVELTEEKTGDNRAEASRFQEAFAAAHDCREGIAAMNGTVTLEIILRAAGIGPGDEVIVPAYTFIATASAVLQVGAVPVFADIRRDTCNIDPAKVEAEITPRTRAIIPVHFAGQSADMDSLSAIAKKRNLVVIEDAAHAHGAEWQGRKCGSLGLAASFSFQNSKNMTAGEGGIITTFDSALAELCRSYLWAGRVAGRPWYEHHRLGGNYRITEFQAALLRVGLGRLQEQTERRDRNGRYLSKLLSSNIKGVEPLFVDDRCTLMAYHIFMFRYNPAEFGGRSRADFLKALAAEGVPCLGGYSHPLYRNPMFANKNFWKGSFPCQEPYGRELDYSTFAEKCPECEAACNETVWLPQNLFLGEKSDMDDIALAIAKIQRNKP